MNLGEESLPEHHLYYEFSMLVSTSILLQDKSSIPMMSDTQKNALLESFLVHLRNLKDFLWEKERIKDDITASDFCSNWSWEDRKKTDTLSGITIEDLDRLVNKQISHLTEFRENKQKGKTQWMVREITCDMVQFFVEFLQEVNGSIRREYLDEMSELARKFQNAYCLGPTDAITPTYSAQTPSTTTVTISVLFDVRQQTNPIRTELGESLKG